MDGETGVNQGYFVCPASQSQGRSHDSNPEIPSFITTRLHCLNQGASLGDAANQAQARLDLRCEGLASLDKTSHRALTWAWSCINFQVRGVQGIDQQLAQSPLAKQVTGLIHLTL